MKEIIPRDIKHRELRTLARLAAAHGWVILKRNNGHLAWKSPLGATVFTASTPSDHRAIKQIRTDLRRNGLSV